MPRRKSGWRYFGQRLPGSADFTRRLRRGRSLEPLEQRTLLAVAPIGLSPADLAEARQAALVSFDGPDLVGKDGPLVKLGFDLNLVYQEGKIARARGGSLEPSNPLVRVVGDRVVVDVAGTGDMANFQTKLRALGMEINGVAGVMVSGTLPIDALDDLAAVDQLRLARPVYIPRTSVGSVDSQGDAAMLTDIARTTLGLDGTGITIGVLSDSYDTSGDGSAAADITSGDLPTVNVLEDLPGPGSSDEGRGMLQLVHDVAPGASLAFATAFTGEAGFATNIRRLANEANSDVIVDDVFFFAEPFYQDGVIAQAVDEVVGQGVAYFSAAGNSADQAYESAFNDSGRTGRFGGGILHDFDPGPGIDTLQQLTVPSGFLITFVLQWSEPFGSLGGAGSSSDVDIFLIDSDGAVISESRDANIGGDALEVLQTVNFSGDDQVSIAIELNGGAAPELMRYLFVGPASIDEFDSGGAASFGHSNATGAMGVAASAFFLTPAFGQDPPILNDFSSTGGTPFYFAPDGTRLPQPEFRSRPNVTGPDGTNTTFFGQDIGEDADTFPNFFGTSAAAPHVAALAALMLEAAGGPGSVTPQRIYSVLESTAIDIVARDVPNGVLSAGYDFFSGHGLVDGVAAIQAIVLPALPSVSIDDVRASEGNSGQKNFDFTITLSEAAAAPVTIEVRTLAGTATAGADFLSLSNVVTFAPGELSQTVSIAVVGERIIEADETFFVTLSNPVGLELGDFLGAGTIVNDDRIFTGPIPDLRISDVSRSEGDFGTSTFVFTVTLSQASEDDVTVSFATANAPPLAAFAGRDYEAAAGTVTFTAGATTQFITVTVVGDLTIERNETFFVNLFDASGANIVDAQGLGTIINEDLLPPRLYVGDVTMSEDPAGNLFAVFSVAISGATKLPVTVEYATADGTATAGADYLAQTDTLTFTVGESTQQVFIPILDDTVDEANETFFLNLSNATIGAIADPQGMATIVDREGGPFQQIIDDNNLGYTISGQWDSSINLLAYQLDYAASASGTGRDKANWRFNGLDAGDYQVFVRWVPFSNRATNAPYTVFDGATALGTVRLNQQLTPDDDVAEGLGWESVGTFGVASGALRVMLTDDANGFVTADAVRIVRVSDGAVVAPEIDVAVAGVSIAAGDLSPSAAEGTDFGEAAIGQESLTRTFVITNAGGAALNLFGGPRVAVTGANASDFTVVALPASSVAAGGTTTFQVMFNPTVVGTRTALITVINNDDNEGVYEFSIQGLATEEPPIEFVVDDGDAGFGQTGVWTTLANAFSFGQDHRVHAAGGTDLATWNFTGLAPGEYDIFASWSAFVNRSTAALYSVVEGAVSRGTATVNQQNAPNDVSSAGVDWELLGAFSTVTGGLTVHLNSAAGGVVVADAIRLIKRGSQPSAVLSALPQLSIASTVTVTETDGTDGSAVFVVQMSAPSANPVIVSFATSDGSAKSATDYTSTSGLITFAPGVTRQTIRVPIVGDRLFENDETFAVTLAQAQRATLGRDRAEATIVDVDVSWQNPTTAEDVNRDGRVTPLDALVVINRLNATGSATLSNLPGYAVTQYFDASGDGQLTPIDALRVINRLNLGIEPAVASSIAQSAPVLPAAGGWSMARWSPSMLESQATENHETSIVEVSHAAIPLEAAGESFLSFDAPTRPVYHEARELALSSTLSADLHGDFATSRLASTLHTLATTGSQRVAGVTAATELIADRELDGLLDVLVSEWMSR